MAMEGVPISGSPECSMPVSLFLLKIPHWVEEVQSIRMPVTCTEVAEIVESG